MTTETTTVLPDSYRLDGVYGTYIVRVARSQYGEQHTVYVPLTECCEASGKGSMDIDGEGITVCRACYAEVDPMFGACWVGDEFATRGPIVVQSRWVIVATDDWDDEGHPLYWNDTDGWGDLESANRYPNRWSPARLPLGGVCVLVGGI